MKTDILIVGSGCSGLYAALHLPADKQITIITKADLESSDSFLAQGGICMLRDEDDYNSYFQDTMKAGHYENNRQSVDIMIRESQRVIADFPRHLNAKSHLKQRKPGVRDNPAGRQRCRSDRPKRSRTEYVLCSRSRQQLRNDV